MRRSDCSWCSLIIVLVFLANNVYYIINGKDVELWRLGLRTRLEPRAVGIVMRPDWLTIERLELGWCLYVAVAIELFSGTISISSQMTHESYFNYNQSPSFIYLQSN